MGKIEVAPHVIEAILNHKSGIISGIAAIYNKYGYEREKNVGLCRYGEYVDALIQNRLAKGTIDETTAVANAKAGAAPTRFPRLAQG